MGFIIELITDEFACICAFSTYLFMQF